MTNPGKLHTAAAKVLHRKATHHCWCFAEFLYLGHHLYSDPFYMVPIFVVLVIHSAIELIGGDA